MNRVCTYKWLCEKMQNRGLVAIISLNQNGAIIRGIINGIKPKDNSGKNWIVTINNNITNNEVHIKTR